MNFLDDFKSLKKAISRRNKRATKLNQLEMNEDGTKRSMFDLDIQMCKVNLDADLLNQVSNLTDSAESNKKAYLEKLKKLEEWEKSELPNLRYFDYKLLESNNYEYENLLNGQKIDQSIKPEDIAVWEEATDPDPSIVDMIKTMKKEKKSNLTDMMKSMRLITTCAQILTSPIYRYEIDRLFALWIKVYFDSFKRQFCSRFSVQDDDSEDEEMEESLADFFKDYSYKHEIKLGGILKQLINAWKADEIFNACILVALWLSGHLYSEETEDEYGFYCKDAGLNFTLEDYKNSEAATNGLKERKSLLNNRSTARIIEMVCRWAAEIKKLDDNLNALQKNEARIRYTKQEKLLKTRKTVNDMLSNLTRHQTVSNLLSVNDDGEDISMMISKEDLRKLLVCEANIRCFAFDSDLSTHPFVLTDVKRTEFELWVLANAVSEVYISVTQVCHHLTASIYDHLMVEAIEGRGDEDLAQVKSMLVSMTVDELALEYKLCLSTNKEIKLDRMTYSDIEDIMTDNHPDDEISHKFIETILSDEYIQQCVREDSSGLANKIEEQLKKVKLKQRPQRMSYKSHMITNKRAFLSKQAYLESHIENSEMQEFFKSLLKNMEELLESIINIKNATRSADNMYKLIEKAYQSMNPKLLQEVEPGRRFRYDEKGNIENRMIDKTKWSRLRRFLPEFKTSKDADKETKNKMVIPKEVWAKVRKYIEYSYWKVQVGFVTWYALLVYEAEYENAVQRILDRAEFGKCVTRDAAIKILSIISEHYKLHSDADYISKYPEIVQVPYYVFSAVDTIFGYTDENEIDCLTWKEDVLKTMAEWVGYFPPEHIGSFDINYDFEIAMENFLRDFKDTYSPRAVKFGEVYSKTVSYPSRRLSQLRDLEQLELLKRDEKSYFEPEEDKSFTVMNYFNDYCKNFLKFSVDGSAQGLKIDVDKLYLKDEVKEAKEQENQSIPTNLPESVQKSASYPVDHQIDIPDQESSDAEVKAMIARKSKIMHIEEDYLRDSAHGKEKSISKTLAYAFGGKNLARLLVWCGGVKYVPELNIHLKTEKKKIRLVANSDVVSFTKQSFMYEWVSKALPEATKELIYTLIHPRDKVMRMERFMECFDSEKWLCPMDLKDFQRQFGPVHHRTILRCFLRRARVIPDENLSKELVYVIESLIDEMCRGIIFFRKNSEENFEPAKMALDPELRKFIKHFECKIPQKKSDGEDFEDHIDSEMKDDAEPNQMTEEELRVHEMIEEKSTGDYRGSGMINQSTQEQEPDSPKETEKPVKDKYRLLIAFDALNGLLSGWKVTSLFGSIYNYSTNNLVNFWSLYFLGIIPTDYATQGDDTHFKTRFLAGSLFHTAMINAIGKEAHPKKQFFSTRYTEFLKKTYDLHNKSIRYQPVRLISSILYENENRESKSNQINNLKDSIDLWNQFLVRLPCKKRVDYIAKTKKYPQRGIRVKYRWQANYSLTDIDKLVSTPEAINSFLSGPLTFREYVAQEKDGKVMIMNSYAKAKMFDSLLEFQHGVTINKWSGIQAYSNGVINKLSSSSQIQLPNKESLRSDLSKQIFYAISESLCEYQKSDKELGVLEQLQMPAATQRYVQAIEAKLSDIYQEIESNLVYYLRGKNIRTPYGQLMILNNSFSMNIERILRTQSLTNHQIFDTLSSLTGGGKLTQHLFSKCIERMSCKLVFEFALKRDMGISITRQVIHDEYIGTLALIASETLPLILINTYNIRGIFSDNDQQQEEFLNTLIIYLESDIFLHRHVRLVNIIRQTAQEIIFEKPF